MRRRFAETYTVLPCEPAEVTEAALYRDIGYPCAGPAQDLGARAVQAPVARFVDRPHRARAQRLERFVVPQAAAGQVHEAFEEDRTPPRGGPGLLVFG